MKEKTDSRSILCGFEGAEKPETEAKKGEKRSSWIAEPKKPGSEGESPGRAEVDGRSKPNRISGDNSLRDPPVPIPNTEVKPQHADGTWLETARESRSSPDSIFSRSLFSMTALFFWHAVYGHHMLEMIDYFANMC